MNKSDISKKIGIILMIFSIFCYMIAISTTGSLFSEISSDFGNGIMLIAIAILLLSLHFRFDKLEGKKD